MPLHEFVTLHPGLYLLKRPDPRADVGVAAADSGGALDYRTREVPAFGSFEIPSSPGASGWRLLPIRKRPNGPFPDSIGVGRAPNCDVVLRYPFISKLHAQFLRDSLTMRLVDRGSANGTCVNGTSLEPEKPMIVQVGDVVTFGKLELKVVDAPTLYAKLKREARTD
jgi:hypothetical protein